MLPGSGRKRAVPSNRMITHRYKGILETLYARYNRRRYVHPDPLEFLYRYEDLLDREVAGLVAATLAVGRVEYILRSVACVLERLSDRPSRLLEGTNAAALGRRLADCRHRFLTGEDLAAMLWGARQIQRRSGSIGAFFAAAVGPRDETVIPALGALVSELCAAGGRCGRILAHPCDKSACKRLNLYLRWMVRSDAVDPGGWDAQSPRLLVVPLDTHMHRLGREMGLTKRRPANLATALEITAAFRRIAPDDPVRYDFALTRLGIRDDTDRQGFLRQWCAARVP